jgi:hypothetical protein
LGTTDLLNERLQYLFLAWSGGPISISCFVQL